ncbi:sulfotransferase family protein [Flavobacteriaceae bacterium TK19130]|nr:sulfotransferase family protein [Thermobacterium salinum]
MKLRAIFKVFSNYMGLVFHAFRYAAKGKHGGYINSVSLNAQHLLHSYFEKEYVFIHINKNGGSSIEKALGDIDQVHMDALTLKNFMGSETYNKKFSFAFVRNPYDRIVSQYHYRLGNNQTGIEDQSISFKDWLRITYVEKNPEFVNYPLMFQTQWDWVSDKHEEQLVDFIGRFETMQQDFDTICDRIGIPRKTLPHKRKSERKQEFDSYFDRESLDIVNRVFAVDFERFGYQVK